MLLGVFEPWSLGGEVVKSHLQDSKARRLQEEQHTRGSRGLGNSPPGIGVGIARSNADRFERFTIKPPALPEVSDWGTLVTVLVDLPEPSAARFRVCRYGLVRPTNAGIQDSA